VAYVIKTCEGCGETFTNLPGRNGKVNRKKRYCTRHCSLTRRHAKMPYKVKTCEGCGDTFVNTPGKNGKIYHAKRHCSRTCWLKRYNANDRVHSVTGGIAGGAANAEFLKAKHVNTSRYVGRTGQLEHRMIAEQILRRKLSSHENVHHEDMNKSNNDPHNLFVFKTKADHNRHHYVCMNQGKTCQCSYIRLSDLIGGDK
jgi:hypothetical protein